MASKIFLKNDSNLALDFLRKPSFFTRPQLTSPIARTTVIDEARRLPPNRKSQHPHSAFSLAVFLGVNQKLFAGEEGLLGVRECYESTLGGALWAKGRSGSPSSRGKIDSEEEVDDGDLDAFDDDEDFDEEAMDDEFPDDFDDDEEEEFGSDEDEDEKHKKSRRK